jgi:UDP-N-acetylmuramoyl-tripeptide--D-alanyl-D-alanine ligase
MHIQSTKNKVPSIVQWWMTPKLPREHIFIDRKNRPTNKLKLFNIYFRKWLVHPTKRRLSKYYLEILRRFCGLKVVGITGSAGKTTTKEIILSIAKESGQVVASIANIDPVYNIPTTILRCTPKTKYLILEMGVEYPGEMDYYLWLAKPDVSLIINIYPTHLKYFGNERGVFIEKRKLVLRGKPNAVIVLNKGNIYLRRLARLTNGHIVWFGDNSDINAIKIMTNDMGTDFTLDINKSKYSVHIQTLGKQFVDDVLAATAICKELGFSDEQILKGIKSFKALVHRMNVIKLKSGATLVDDSYNNNPKAATEALESFANSFPNKRKVVIFGDMLELGKFEDKYHKEIGELLSNLPIENVIYIGNATFKIKMSNGNHYNVWKDSLPEIKKYLSDGYAILVKGSRSIGLDKLVEALLVI